MAAQGLQPFFHYYGGKWKLAPYYPRPTHKRIIEPFAGSAGYSTRYFKHEVLLCDLDPIIAGVWNYLIHVGQDEFLRLPIPRRGQSIDTFDIPQEAKWLIGFWFFRGAFTPQKLPNYRTGSVISDSLKGSSRLKKSDRKYWDARARARIAKQLPHIRHWKIVHGSYADLEDVEATWFVDPPYFNPGKKYRCHELDYGKLAQWCEDRRGQLIVCEGGGADWLPFKLLRKVWGQKSQQVNEEVVYLR